MTLKEFFENNTDNLRVRVYTGTPWHEHDAVYDSFNSATPPSDALLKGEIYYLFIDEDVSPAALVIEIINPGIYAVESAEDGVVFKEGLTHEEALHKVALYEESDMREGTYKEGYYSVRNTDTDEFETI